MYSDHAGLELLSAEECLDLLRTRSVGRIGLSASSLPFVVPVRYVVDEDRILMRAGRDTRMAAATNDAVVAFEVDEFDQDLDAGWSVMVQGLAREVTATTLVDPAAEAVLSSWVGSAPARCFSIPIEIVSGARLHPVAHRSGALRIDG
jgi:nitroimidazol reductase NimA-like FMN-containing flavoprotein (pyridoxamine 5'-phosphate oxidase superfamily)